MTNRFSRLFRGVLLSAALLIPVEAASCTAVILSGKVTSSGRPVLLKVRDNVPELCNTNIQYFDTGKYRFIGSVAHADRPHAQIGEVFGGCNEAGLALVSLTAHGFPLENAPDRYRSGRFMYEALSCCSTLDQVEALARKIQKKYPIVVNISAFDSQGNVACYEFGGHTFTKYDVNDPAVAPEGYRAQANFCFTGDMSKGVGQERYEDAMRGLASLPRDAAGRIIVDHAAILDAVVRSWCNVDAGIEGREALKGQEYFAEDGFVLRRKSNSDYILEGVKPGEDPLHTLMWVNMGHPACTPAIPLMVGKANLIPECIWPGDAQPSPICLRGLQFKKNTLYAQEGKVNIKSALDLCDRMAGVESYIDSLFCPLHRSFVEGTLPAEEFYKAYAQQCPLYYSRYLAAIAPYDNAGYSYLESSFGTYHDLSRLLFGYAEPGYQEQRSVKALSEHLSSHGFTIESGIGGIPTAFKATFGSGHPVIGILGEYDALPGMSQDTVSVRKPLVEGGYGHACGHNTFGTAAAAACVAISKWLALGHRGTIVFFGCPAEEGGGGKSYMTREGCFDGVDMVFDWHPGNVNEVSMDTWSANINVMFSFKGVPAHAGLSPWKGRSALDAVELFNYAMNMMREHVQDGVRIHYIINNGGKAPNVVPELAQVNYYIRHPEPAVMLDVLERAKKAAEGAAIATGTEWSFELLNGNYPKLINRTLSEVMCRNLVKVGGVVLDEREKKFALELLAASPEVADKTDLSNFTYVRPTVRPTAPRGSSSDVGSVSQVAPLASLSVSTFSNAGGLHSWQNAATAGMTIGTKGLMNVAKVFYLSAVELYSDASLVEAVRDEYEAVRGPQYRFVPLMGDRRPPLDYRK